MTIGRAQNFDLLEDSLKLLSVEVDDVLSSFRFIKVINKWNEN